MEIPVYLFTGFLEAGKTTFIQSILEGEEFNAGERTLLLICEEGIEEYDESKYAFPNVFGEVVSEDEFTKENLKRLRDEHYAERVVMEYNGMWPMQNLFRNLPDEWIVYQAMMFADAGTFEQYNRNMRQITFDKMQTADIVVFNRCDRATLDKQKFHDIVRVANRRSQILYEFAEDDVEIDDIEDPLPFDLDADIVEIKDEDFAEWYRDITEEQDKYDGKVLHVRGRAAKGPQIPRGRIVFGRHIMTCCVEDIQFGGLVCRVESTKGIENGDWVEVTGEVKVEDDILYGPEGPGPVIHCTEIKKCAPAEPEVATF